MCARPPPPPPPTDSQPQLKPHHAQLRTTGAGHATTDLIDSTRATQETVETKRGPRHNLANPLQIPQDLLSAHLYSDSVNSCG